MNKIKSIKQLKAEKKRLQQRRAELEKAIHYDWRDLKDSLKPGNVASQVFSKMFEEKEKKNGNSFFSESASKIAALFTQKLAEKAETKFGKWFKK